MSSTISSTASYESMANCSARPFELPKKSKKSTLGIQVPLDDDPSLTHIVAAADATADSTMHREYVIDTNISKYRVVKVIPDTGSTSSNFVVDKIAGWIESVERQLSSNCYLPSKMHHQPTTVSMTWNGAHTVVWHPQEFTMN